MSITPSPRRLGKKKVRDGCDAGLYINIIICNRLLRSDSFFFDTHIHFYLEGFVGFSM